MKELTTTSLVAALEPGHAARTDETYTRHTPQSGVGMLPRSLALLALVLGATLGVAQAQPLAVPVPTAGLMPNPGQGRDLFIKNCASCHGESLRGSDKGPPFLHPIYEPSHHGDAAFQMAAKYGSRAHHWKFGDMPPVKGVTPDQVAHITAYVRSQQRMVGIQ
jgi:mono/diheme cytochrome c family protein